jgi:hypothetical protein
MTNFKTLYHFESESFSLIEIKRILPNETDKSKLFFWLLFDKPEATLMKLNFVSMHSDGDTELRFFEKEQLSFDSQKALLILNNEEQQLDVMPTDSQLNTQLQQAIDAFLKKL